MNGRRNDGCYGTRTCGNGSAKSRGLVDDALVFPRKKGEAEIAAAGRFIVRDTSAIDTYAGGA